MTDADALREGAVQDESRRSPPRTAHAAPADDGKVMSLVDHLTELRNRLFKVLLTDRRLQRCRRFASKIITSWHPARPGAGSSTSARATRSRSPSGCRSSGVVLSMPVILYQLWAFVAPGLTARAKAIRPWIPLALLFFVAASPLPISCCRTR